MIYKKIFLFGILVVFLQCSISGHNGYNTKEVKNLVKDIESRGGVKPPLPKDKYINWMGYWKGEGKREVLIQKVLDEFEFLHQDVRINMKFPEDIEQIQQIDDLYFKQIPIYTADMIKTEMIEWDIIPLIGASYSYVADELNDPHWGVKHLVDFIDVPGFKETQKDFILNNKKYQKSNDGIFIGPYIEGYYYMIFYNQRVADKIGLRIKHFDMKYEDLLGYIKKVDQYNEINGTNIASFYDASDWILVEIIFQHLFKSVIGFSNSYEIPNFFTKKNRKGLIKTLKAFEEMGKFDPLIHSVDSNTWDKTKGLVLDDKALFYINGSWMYNNWEGIDKEKVKKMIPAELPVFNKIDYYMGGYDPNFAVLSDSPNRDLAVELLMYWTNKDIVQDWIRFAKSPSGTYGHMNISGFGGDIHELFVNTISDRFGHNIGYYDSDICYIFGKNSNVPFKRFCDNLHLLLKGKKTAEEVYIEMEKFITS